MKTLVRMYFGSHLYGTETPESDIDIKAVYLPSAEDILLQHVRAAINATPSKRPGEKNAPGDVDFEAYSPQKFLSLLAEGQTVALDMLFAPDSALLEPPHPVWRDIQALAPRLFSRRTTAFVSYCRQQARKFGIKGARLAAVRLALEGLSAIERRYGSLNRLSVARSELVALAAKDKLLQIVELPNADGSSATYFDIAGKKAIFSASIKQARGMVENLFNEFGERTRAAEAQDGVDWKAMSHAVRIARQGIEFLQTQQLVFPRPEAAHLMAIRKGQLPYTQVASEIETLLDEIETIAAQSNLPDDYDLGLIDAFLLDLHRRIVENRI